MTGALLKKLMNQSFQELLINRQTALITTVLGFLFLGVEVVAGVVFYEQTDTILGWSQTDYLFLIASSSTISFLYQMLFIASHENLADTIIEGELDHILLKPVDSLLYFSLYRIDFPSLINLTVALALQVYLLSNYELSFLKIILVLVSLILAVYLLYLLNQLAVSVSFWVDRAGSIIGLPEYLTDFSSRPLIIYPKSIRFIFTWIIPIMIAINLPALILKGQSVWTNLIFLISIDIFGSFLVVYVWRKGLEKYVSSN